MKNFYAILMAIFLLPLLSRGQTAIDLTATGNKITGTYNLNLTAGFTVEYWFKMNAAPTTGQAFGTFSKGTANLPQPIDVYINSAGQFGYLLGNGSTFTGYSTTFSPVVGTWYHIAHTYDAVSGLSTLYVNGVSTHTATQLGLSNSVNPFYMGNRADDATEANITIDELRIWSVVRTGTQISTNKNACLTGSESGLDVYYKMNEGTGTVLTDLATTNGSQNGTITGTVAWGVSPIDPVAPSVSTPVFYAQGATASALTATGTTLLWYTAATGGTGSATAPTPSTATVSTTSYWVTQTNASGCEGPRAKIDVTVALPATHLNFDGVDDYVTLTADNIAVPTTNFTHELWFKTTNLNGCLFSAYQGNALSPSGYDRTIYLESGLVKARLWINTADIIASTATYNDGNWHHVAHVVSAAGRKLYVDGVVVASNATTASVFNTNTNVSVGAGIGTSVLTFFQGSIDEVRIWNVAQTADDILRRKNCELVGNESGLVRYYKFNQGINAVTNTTVTSLTDTKSIANGTLTGFTLTGATSNWLSGSTVTTGSTIPTTPSVTTPVTYCQNATASALTATGTSLKWYTAATGGVGSSTAPTPITTTAGNTSYWVTSSNANGCESARAEIVVTINATPAAPSVSTPVFYAQNSTASALTATGTSLLWYTVSTGGAGSATAPTPSTTTLGTTSYWVSQTVSTCESPRTKIDVTVALPATHLHFNGVNDQVNFGTSLNAVLDPLNTISVEAWVRPENTVFNGIIIGNYSTPVNAMQFLMRRDGASYSFFVDDGTGYKVVTATNAVVINTWQHLAGVWNGADIKIYVDGVLKSTLTGVTGSSFATVTNTVIIGSNSVPEPFAGGIDEVRIWNTAVSVDDILRRKNCELQGNESGLLRYYKFNQGINALTNTTVTSLIDATANASNGTLTNFTLTGATSNWLSGSTVITGSTIPTTPSVSTPVSYCINATASALTATGTSMKWYTAATGGVGSSTAPTPITTTAGNTSYWVTSSNANGCESARAEIVVTINAKPVVSITGANAICVGATTTLSPTTGGTWASSNNAFATVTNAGVVSGVASGAPTFTFTQTSTGCVSLATAAVTVNANPAAPTVSTPVLYAQNATASALTATGASLLWYTVSTGGSGNATAPIPSTTTVGTTSYWVSQTVSTCESPRAKIDVTVALPATHLNFDGVNDNVNFGNSISTTLDPLNTITVEAWVRPETNIGTGVIVGNFNTPTSSQMQFLLRRESDVYTFWVNDGTGFKNVNTPANAVVINTWQHIVGVWNGADIKIYIDGVLKATTTGVIGASFASTANNMVIGALQSTEFFKGDIDEVRIWNTAQAADDILRRKNCELQGNEPGLLRYYKFDQGINAVTNTSVTSLTDAVAVPNNGTITNFTLTGATSNWLSGSPVTTGSTIPTTPSVSTPVSYCINATASALTATGTSMKWYTAATGGVGSSTAPTPITTTAGNTSYWVTSSNANGCESARALIVVTINAKPTVSITGANAICVGATTALSPTTGGTWASSNIALATVTNAGVVSGVASGAPTFTFTQTSTGCVSLATAAVTVNAIPAAPSVSTPVLYAQNATASALTATGTSLLWYTASTGGTGSATAPTPITTTVGTTSYWVSQTVSTCESARAKIDVTVALPATHLHFDGVNDQINFGTSLNAVLDPINTFTVEAWVRPENTTFNGIIIGNYSTPANAMQFLLRRDGASYSFFIDDGSGYKVVTATNAVVLNTWQHLAGVWNGVDIKIYINGVLISTLTGVTGSSFATVTNTVVIGSNSVPEPFAGGIDEVRIWSTAVSADDIVRRKNCELQGNESGLLRYYKFNQGIDAATNTSVTSLTDATANANNGSLNGFDLTGSTSNWLAGSPVTTGIVVPTATITGAVSACTSVSLTASGGTTYAWSGGATPSVSANSFTTSGAYTVTVTNANGCSASTTATATVVDCNDIYTGATSCHTVTLNNVQGNAWFDFIAPSGIIASINPNGTDMGTVTLEVSDAGDVINYNGVMFLGRSTEFTSSNYPNSAVMPNNYSLRIYYKDSELTEYNAAMGGSFGLSDFNMTWQEGGSGCNLATYNGGVTGVVSKTQIVNSEYGTGNNGFYFDLPLNHFTIFAATTSNAIILPIELISFSGYTKNDDNILEWQTATEENSSHFELQHSLNGIDFEMLGKITAEGKSAAPKSYSYLHQNPKATTHYYRLKMVDKDGSFKYSLIVSLTNSFIKKSADVIKVFPNPTKDNVNIITTDYTQPMRLYNASGALMLSTKLTTQQLDMSKLPAGIYFLHVGKDVIKVVKE